MYNETTQDQLQGICKDCGAGTLNNRINHTFDLDDDFNTLAFKFLMFYREAWGVTVFYGTWGSSPA